MLLLVANINMLFEKEVEMIKLESAYKDEEGCFHIFAHSTLEMM